MVNCRPLGVSPPCLDYRSSPATAFVNTPSSRRLLADPWSLAALTIALVFCAAPLFIGLDRYDMHNDEAIYSYAVHRILETGDWLNPRAIPSDDLFIEKPPLKYWLVGGAMKLGLIPRNDGGMRAWDPVFGTVAFVYVFLLGRRLAGPVCGLVAVFTLFMVRPLVFDHGLRSNNMEAALFLAYTGGIYHLMRWVESPEGTARRHTWAAAGFIVLGFMTKFVAIVFLPAIVAAAALWRPGGPPRLKAVWRDWWRPAVAAVLAVAPWFIYQIGRLGDAFLNEIFGAQVFKRFTTYLDPSHLQPWHFYFTSAWHEMDASGLAWLTAAGGILLVWRAVAKQDWTARVFLLWWILPVPLISIGSSKIFHYLYPFLPPLALATGLAASTFLALISEIEVSRVTKGSRVGRWLDRPGVRHLVVGLGVAAVGLALWTSAFGRVVLEVGEVQLFRNSAVARPLVVGLVFLGVTGFSRSVFRAAVVAALVALMPLSLYANQLRDTLVIERPLAVFEACAPTQQALGNLPTGLLAAVDGEIVSHTYYYHLRHLGRWEVIRPEALAERLVARMKEAGGPTPAFALRSAWVAARQTLASSPEGQRVLASLDESLEFPEGTLLLVPRAYQRCTLEAAQQSTRWSARPK